MRYITTCLLLLSVAIAGAQTLPLRCLWPLSPVASVTLTLPAGAQATYLRLRENNIMSDAQSAFRVNGGGWQPLGIRNSRVSGPGSEWATSPRNAVANLTLTRPIPAVSGSVTLEFRQNDPGPSAQSAWRVLSLELLDRAGRVLSAPIPQEVSPVQAIQGDAGAGKVLFQSAPLHDAGKTILAHCADCHARAGSDLAAFNYSNSEIVSRSLFHGLTQAQATDIACYLRTLPATVHARPWHPAYQPGPGLDARPVAEWSAGAGDGAVLAEDRDMALPDVVNARETRLALPLLTWNQWLPSVHPIDFYGAAYTNSTLAETLATIEDEVALASADPTDYLTSHRFAGRLDHFNSVAHDFEVANFRGVTQWSVPLSEAAYSVAQLRAVKAWDWMHALNAEDKTALTFAPNLALEARGWVGAVPFETSPKTLGIPFKAGVCLCGDPKAQSYLGDVWYTYQTILNPGMGQGQATAPIDWTYFYSSVIASAGVTHKPVGMRLGLSILLGLKECGSGVAPNAHATGFAPMNAGAIYYIVHDAGVWRGEEAQEARVLNTLLSRWLALAHAFPPAAYYAAGLAEASQAPPPRLHVFGAVAPFIDTVAYMRDQFTRAGADPTLLAELRTWARGLWPSVQSF